ncbi:hypothetical protein H311_04780, partial [Anncaliia algerae PRA109]
HNYNSNNLNETNDIEKGLESIMDEPLLDFNTNKNEKGFDYNPDKANNIGSNEYPDTSVENTEIFSNTENDQIESTTNPYFKLTVLNELSDENAQSSTRKRKYPFKKSNDPEITTEIKSCIISGSFEKVNNINEVGGIPEMKNDQNLLKKIMDSWPINILLYPIRKIYCTLLILHDWMFQ